MDAVRHEFVNLAKVGLAPEKACARLAASLQAGGERVLILCADETQAREMDRLLWEFDPVSFVPHGLMTEEGAEQEPVLICFGEASNRNQAEILISLYIPELPFTGGFKHVIQFVPAEDGPELKKARDRYRELKNSGMQLMHTTHLN
ncbi:DNA polymerase III subunit chi [Dethiosulfatarculus sandiegensis]|nr:DNA polymerase III subunit chi [Dethiosulfatarculus sandiegensis]